MKPSSTTILLIIVFFILYAQVARSASYDIYVDENYSKEDSDGSSKKPYTTITRALEKAGSGKKIYIRSGTYKETLTLKKEVELYGQKRDSTIIQGTIEATENNKLKDLTISGKSYGIIAEGKIAIENCKIKNSAKIGLDLLESDKEASIIDSIFSGNGKGIYVQRKRSLFLNGSYISNNREEGLDIREKVKGIIRKNELAENGESGLEIIVGGSDLKINDNTFKKNKASGITAQFYSFIEKTGSILIQNNVMSKNGKYGFACGIPSGGNPAGSYWNKSIELKENILENNRLKALDDFCNLVEALDEEEKKTNTTIQNELAPPESEVGERPDAAAQEKEVAEIKEQLIEKQLIEQNAISAELIASLEQEMEKMESKNKFKNFIRGINPHEFDALKEKNDLLGNQISLLENLFQETGREETLNSLNKMLDGLKTQLAKTSDFIAEKEKPFSLFGWIFKLFNR